MQSFLKREIRFIGRMILVLAAIGAIGWISFRDTAGFAHTVYLNMRFAATFAYGMSLLLPIGAVIGLLFLAEKEFSAGDRIACPQIYLLKAGSTILVCFFCAAVVCFLLYKTEDAYSLMQASLSKMGMEGMEYIPKMQGIFPQGIFVLGQDMILFTARGYFCQTIALAQKKKKWLLFLLSYAVLGVGERVIAEGTGIGSIVFILLYAAAVILRLEKRKS